MTRRLRPALTDATRAVVYARVSTEEQAEHGASLDAQLAEARDFARRNGLTVVSQYVERGASGTDDRRPEFRRMLDDLAAPANRVGTVVVVHTSRFMRDAAKARVRKEQLRRQGVRVVSVQQPVEDDATGRFVEGMFELIDQLESEQIGRRTRAGMRQNAVNGYWNGSAPPFGYRVVTVPGPGGKAKRKLQVEPSEAELVGRVFALYLANNGAVEVAKQLNASGARYRGKLWDRDKVLRVISNPAAVGRVPWGRRDPTTGSPLSDDKVAFVEVEPIIDQELFDLAQLERSKRDPEKNPGRAASSPLLLAGLVRCGQCGARYELQTAGKTRPDGSRYAYYQCCAARRSGVGSACDGHPVPVEELDRAVIESLARQLFDQRRCRVIIEELVEREGLLRHRAARERRRWETEARSLETRRAKLLEVIETGELPAGLVATRLGDVATALADARAKLRQVAVIHETPPQLNAPDTLARFESLMREALVADVGVSRAYLHALVARIVVRQGGGAEVVGQLPNDGLKRPAPLPRTRRWPTSC
ncbi:MAG: recombinase family protein [Myxococcales bacterium]|nr:recombinase family protein [Myxococcales bacterium]